ncbi:hypothetical protein [Phytopseudomonas dryadis]|uniref:Uncharacterized protein n=1 Tax=Phytopseudomonas dryadis TaxID=2487520 RepID=A0A4Q9R1N0_9GAMM|nr:MULTISPECIES: hypothetical protein [Pseudomonas]TBU92888.1 hypothetical protein DNK44_10955 [Pseudomonas dryadis]TBV04632.1 hypothetical protein DNK34_13865 [Pseudomonas dryadis]TBV17280.1 hypothetical protein DNK41_13215 [Pseudomonas sp. FRB 230]
MKSQDVLLLIKLICLEQRERLQRRLDNETAALIERSDIDQPGQWQGWEDQSEQDPPVHHDSYSVRALQASLGISKTEIAAALKRCQQIGLLRLDPNTQLPRVNSKALLGFIEHGLRYVFPVKPAEIVRGIPTGFSAPALQNKLMSGGDLIHVWPDAYGNRKGQSITPLFRTVPGAVKKDPRLYEYLALIDAIRLGNAREANLANEILRDKVLQA